MITKAFEIRDRGTFIPVIAIKMVPAANWPAGTREEESISERVEETERYLLRRAGYGFDEPCVMLVRMDANGQVRQASYDPYGWGERTFPVAHNYIIDHFDELESGAVIDVEFLLGESKEPKQSERVS
jgi:hypothetical protein